MRMRVVTLLVAGLAGVFEVVKMLWRSMSEGQLVSAEHNSDTGKTRRKNYIIPIS